MKSIPFPSSSDSIMPKSLANDSAELPWTRMNVSDPPLIMFQLQFANGSVVSYAYCDLREIRLTSAGYVQLGLYGMEKYLITLEGRHLSELANLLGMAKVKSLIELGPRTFDRPESSPSIDKITVEALTGPSEH